ncbi:MAG: ABC transporter ATP-binding protein, partial [Gemmatimonadetes bacterium]|nr:ABC transporter ATP-binding protein [Gemmatimonadota bacterium]
EPTTALDVTIQAQILALLRGLREQFGMAMILITHDLGVVAEVCDRVLVMYAGQVAEEAPVEKLFRDPRHPYTRGLLQSLPRLGQRLDRLAAIPGNVPNPVAWPAGCRFHPRCPYGWEQCVIAEPPLFPVGPAQTSRCWLERWPEQRAQVDAAGRGFTPGAAPRAPAPAEEYHRQAAALPGVPPAELEPPAAPPREASEPPRVEPDVAR